MNNTEEKVCDYQLIQYEGYLAKYKEKIIKLTPSEAHSLNQGFALNLFPKRYIKISTYNRDMFKKQ